ncbi:MAG: hypothetical protein A2Y57_02815 [Candidatus Woykebacteria bacterium RBG_13_40_7b]|uniref:Ribulose-phosphate 3-epimerase n=1 Tax=Candidatus Woykebacteria bacterium RBG_13_40_7b TaxID=1802594 RepID=A0A1G1W5A9_9BACT|nr:MAG: hypothetical protein A2Y57_02815 [Candidatus Woykebacteria bacterium RBG_13_40_7b]
MVEVLPAIFAETKEVYEEKLRKVEPFVEWVHIDIEDGKFAPKTTIGSEVVGYFKTSAKKEIQLLVKYPDDWVDDFFKIAQASRIIFPVEVEPSGGLKEVIKHIQNHGVEVGVVLNPETSISKIDHIIPDLDLVSIMSVHPGPSGQKFIPDVLPKIDYVKKNAPRIKVEIDGGINLENAKAAKEVGVDIIVAGEYIFGSENIERAIEDLKNI